MEYDRDIVYKRTLRTSIVISRREQQCDYCYHSLDPGEEHEMEVVAVHVRFREDGRVKKMISVWRMHLNGCYPDDDDEDRMENKEEKSDRIPIAA